MKKILCSLITALFILTIFMPAVAAGSDSYKEEAVYGILDSNGKVKNIYVVNMFSSKYIIDYGDYSEIKNLTNEDEIIKNKDEIKLTSSAERFYYQGTLKNKELPWNININYKLDGKSISSEDLGAKNGKLDIEISVSKNMNVKDTFFDNYALQITLTFDEDLCSNIKADNASIVRAGGKKQVIYTALPKKGANIDISADVQNFQMDPISINGIKLSFDLDIDYEEFSSDLNELSKAVKSLDNGAAGMLAGASELAQGMKEYVDGIKAFKENLMKFKTGVGGLNEGALSLSQGLSELTTQNEFITQGANVIMQNAFDRANDQLASMGLGLEILTPDNYDSVLSEIPELLPVKTQLDSAVQFNLGIISYTGGVSDLSDGAKDLSDGIDELEENSALIAASANELYNSGYELSLALNSLRDGLYSYKVGTGKFADSIDNMDKMINDRIEQMLSGITGDGETVSFVSEKNKNTAAVTFVLKTDPIESNDAEDDIKQADTKKELTFWQRFLKLFGLYKEK